MKARLFNKSLNPGVQKPAEISELYEIIENEKRKVELLQLEKKVTRYLKICH